MNTTIYLLGKFDGRITSNVTDYTSSIFENFINKANAETQLIIHRSSDIMSYGYVRRIQDGNLFGICVQLNGMFCSNIDGLFDLFENTIANITIKGELLKLNREGNLVAEIKDFTQHAEVISRVINQCSNDFSLLMSSCQQLPPINFNTVDTDVQSFIVGENAKIVEASMMNGYTFVYKANDFDTIALSGYRSILYNLNKENEDNIKSIKELKRKLAESNRREKRLGLVMVLGGIIFFGIIIFINAIKGKDQVIQEREETIGQYDVALEKSERTNVQLQEENKNTQRQLGNLKDERALLKDSLMVLNNRTKTLTNRNTQLENQNREFNIQLSKLRTECTNLRNENNRYSSETNTLRNDLYKKRNEYNELYRKYSSLSSSYNTLEIKYYSTKEGKKEKKKR